MIKFIKNLIKLCKILATSDVDGSSFQRANIEVFGKNQNVKVLNTYGYSYKPPDNSFGITFNVLGEEDKMFVIIDDPNRRFRGLRPGEVQIGNYLKGTYIHFLRNNNIELFTPSKVKIISDVEVTGNVTANNFISATVPNYNTHKHGGVQTGAGNTGNPF